MFEDLARIIAGRSGVELQPATEQDVLQFVSLGATGHVRDFFTRHEPSACAEIAFVRLWPIQELVVENTRMVPGAASTLTGSW
jgi:hypothetical protein